MSVIKTDMLSCFINAEMFSENTCNCCKISNLAKVKGQEPTKANSDLHDGDKQNIFNKTSTSKPLLILNKNFCRCLTEIVNPFCNTVSEAGNAVCGVV